MTVESSSEKASSSAARPLSKTASSAQTQTDSTNPYKPNSTA